jgi:hypothetical protein
MRVVLLELDLLTGHLTHLPSVRSARSVRSGRPDEQPRG